MCISVRQLALNRALRLIVNISIDLPRHDHHPNEEDGVDDFECKGGSPATTYIRKKVSKGTSFSLSRLGCDENDSSLTDITLRQPSQRIDAISTKLIVRNIVLAIGIDVGQAAIELQRRSNQPRQP